jgi:RNA polymerase sigma-70 factor (ECF subfamily)
VTLPPADGELLLRFRAGDDAALGELYLRYETAIYRFLLGILRDPHRAEDALQDTFIQAFRKSERVDPNSFRGWLFSVAHQQAMLVKRREKRYATAGADGLMGLVDRQATPLEAHARADDIAAAVGLLGELPAGQQAVIRMRIFDGLRFQEVADRLGVPLGTALARMHDGLKALRAQWEERYA